jgi:hypothetical protein
MALGYQTSLHVPIIGAFVRAGLALDSTATADFEQLDIHAYRPSPAARAPILDIAEAEAATCARYGLTTVDIHAMEAAILQASQGPFPATLPSGLGFDRLLYDYA